MTMTSVGQWSVLQGIYSECPSLSSTVQNSHSIGRLRLQRNVGERTEVNPNRPLPGQQSAIGPGQVRSGLLVGRSLGLVGP